MGNGKKRVLVVDDTPAMRELIAAVVENLGYCVFTAGDGKKALNSMKSNGEVDAVITDFNMPEINGAELTMQVKARYQKTKVVFTSAVALGDFKAIAEAVGADAIISKSQIVAELPAILEDLIGPADPFEAIVKQVAQ